MSDYRRGESQSPALAPSRSQAILTWFLYETGLLMMWNSSRDVKYICAQRFVRLFAHGASTLVLVPFLSGVGMSDYRIGLFMTLTQVWDVVISFFLPKYADEAGRKITLLMGALLVFGSGFVFAISSNYWILLAASVVGVISPRYDSFSSSCHSLRNSLRPMYLLLCCIVDMKSALLLPLSSLSWPNSRQQRWRRMRSPGTRCWGLWALP